MNSLKEFENQAKTLITEQNWGEAYKICNQILGYDPENSTFLKLRNKIEKEVKIVNQRAIGHELKKLEPLLEEKRYEEYLKKIAPLQHYAKDFPKISENILKAKKLFDQDYQNRKNQAVNEIAQRIKQKGDQINFESTIQELDQLYKLDVHKEKITRLQKIVKNNYLTLQIKENENLINSQKFENIIIFLLKLKKIDPTNTQVENLIGKVKQRYQSQKIENKKDYIFKTSEEIKTLYITKKYNKCIELAERILEIDPKNLLANNYNNKAKIKANRISENYIIKQILENHKKFSSSKDFRDHNYIKI